MATYYIDLVSGNDSNNGSSWALAKKTIPSALTPVAQSSGDVFLIAKTPSVDVGQVTFTNSSSDIKFEQPSAITMFDEYGSFTNVALTAGNVSPNGSYFVVSGGSMQLVNKYITFAVKDTTTYGALGSINVSAPFGYWSPSNGAYIVLKVLADTYTEFAVSVNGNNQGTGGSGVSSLTVSLDGSTTVTRSASAGGNLCGLTTIEGSYRYIWFDMNLAALQGQTITSLTVFARNTTGTQADQRIYGAWFVNNMPQPTLLTLNSGAQEPSVNGCGLPNRTSGSNQAVGITGGKHVTVSGYKVAGAELRGNARVAALGKLAWDGSTITSSGELLYGIQGVGTLTEATFNVNVKFGVNTVTGVQDGVTAIFGTLMTIGSQASGKLSGLSLYGQAGTSTGALCQLRNAAGSTYFNQGTVDLVEVSSFSTGINVTNPGSTCPTGAFIHYRTIGPNTTDITTASSLSSCTQWSIAPTKAFSSTNTASPTINLKKSTGLNLSIPLYSLISNAIGYLRIHSFSQSGSTSVSSSVSRDRGYSFASSNNETTSITLKKEIPSTIESISMLSTVSTFLKGLRANLFSSANTASTNFTQQQFDRTANVEVISNSGSVWSFGPIKQFPWVAEVVSAVSAVLGRDRGYSFTSTNDLNVAPAPGVARPVSTSLSASSYVSLDSLKRIKEIVLDTITVNSAVASISTFQNKKVQAVVQAVSNITHSPAISRVLSLVSSATTGVVSAIGRSRAGQFAVSAIGTAGINFTRVKDMAFSAVAALTASFPIRKSTKVAFSSSNFIINAFANNTIVAFVTSATSSVSAFFGRNRPTAMSLSALTAATFGTRTERPVDFTSSSTSSSSLSLLRNSGYSFTIPMTPVMTANLARLVGERFIAEAAPVISFVFGKEQTPMFTVISQSGNTMMMAVERPLDMVVGEEVTVDGFIKVRRGISESFGSASATSTMAGVNRGVQFTSFEVSDVLNAIERLVPLAFTSSTIHKVDVASNSNRLDEYFVQYEEPRTYSLTDGSIVVGSKRLVSTGIRQNQHPVFSVIVPAPEVFDIIVKEDD